MLSVKAPEWDILRLVTSHYIHVQVYRQGVKRIWGVLCLTENAEEFDVLLQY